MTFEKESDFEEALIKVLSSKGWEEKVIKYPTEQDLINNRLGLSRLFLNIHNQGYRKCILPTGIYRINRADRDVADYSENSPIIIPTNLTVP